MALTQKTKDALNIACAGTVAGEEISDAIDAAASIDASEIADGAITNAKINASAAIAFSKLAALTSTNILVGNGSNVATAVAMSGDATLANTGALTIANLAVNNAKVASNAAIDFSKLATLASANILVGSAGGVATSVAMSGDTTISNTGAVTIANNVVSPAKQTTAARTRVSVVPFKIVAPTGANQGPFTTPLMVCSQALNVLSVSVLSDVATTGSDGTNHYQFQARNITAAADLHTGPTTTNGGELSATTAKAITLSQNQSFTANQVFGIKVDISDDGGAGPTDLSGANLLCVIEYTI